MEKTKPQIGDTLMGDEWSWPERLEESEFKGWSDSLFPGCQFRVALPHHMETRIAINIKVTGKPRWNGARWQSRVKIEFVGDGEPSTFSGGILYHDHD